MWWSDQRFTMYITYNIPRAAQARCRQCHAQTCPRCADHSACYGVGVYSLAERLGGVIYVRRWVLTCCKGGLRCETAGVRTCFGTGGRSGELVGLARGIKMICS